jgi:hypothetical protein
MFKLINLKWKKEFEELASLHRIMLAEKDAEIKRLERDLLHKHELDLKKAITLQQLNSEQELKQQELNYQRKLDEIEKTKTEEVLKLKEALVKESYDKLSVAMAKLHEEGNLTTKFTQELALKMFEHAPETKVRVLTKPQE